MQRLLLAVGAATALVNASPIVTGLGEDVLTPGDLARARMARPSIESHVHGTTAQEAFAKMNTYLQRLDVQTMPCVDMELELLNEMTRTLHGLRRPDLDMSYHLRKDRRGLHYKDLVYKEQLWKEEAELVRMGRITRLELESMREGKCAENVMMFIHHLTEGQRLALGRSRSFVLSLMPVDVSPEDVRAPEYVQQIGCTSCHLPIHIPGKPPITPIPNKTSDGPQYPESCPINEKTGLPTVWYNRVKRCDWDYVPGCKPCEGVGGIFWGNQEHEWTPMPCEPVASPEEVSVKERVQPFWPKSFTVQEYASLTFPGRDPCNVNFKNSTYTLYFKTTKEGLPIYHTVGHTGPSGPIPFPGSSWATPDGNFWNTIDYNGKHEYCVCLGSIDPVVENAFTGPLTYDFLRGAVYVGREKIKPEYLNTEVIADHYIKGPHAFWFDVETGLMVREMQPFNGLNIYYDWNLTAPSDEEMAVPKLCYEGLFHANITCKSPPPA